MKAQQEKAELKATDLKFPKFAGKSKAEFRSWYDSVLAILACPVWKTVYSDIASKTLRTDDEITESVSSSLFAALRTSLTGNAATLIMTKESTWGKGLLYFSTLKEAYKERLQPADLLDKHMEYLKLFKKPNESYDDFAARCIKLRQTLLDHHIPAPIEGFRTPFIMGLGPLFTDVQQCHVDDLPSRWQTTDMETLTRTAEAYAQERLAVRKRNKDLKDANKEQQANSNTSNSKSNQSDKPKTEEKQKYEAIKKDRQARIEADIKNYIFDPKKYINEVRPNSQGTKISHKKNSSWENFSPNFLPSIFVLWETVM